MQCHRNIFLHTQIPGTMNIEVKRIEYYKCLKMTMLEVCMMKDDDIKHLASKLSKLEKRRKLGYNTITNSAEVFTLMSKLSRENLKDIQHAIDSCIKIFNDKI